MNLQDYIRTKISKEIEELDSAEYKHWVRSYNKVKTLLDEPIPKKIRTDKGKIRSKYKQQLDAKFKSYLNRANKLSRVFELTEDEFSILISKPCVYCGVEDCRGIDRVDNRLGYTLDNSVSCCSMCNMMKFTYTTKTFIRHIEDIYQFIYNN